MTDTAEERQSDNIVAERIRFACKSLGMSVADAEDMAQRAIVTRANPGIKIAPKT